MSDGVVHSKLGASSYYRWKACPGSVALCQTVPKKESSKYAERGTICHTAASEILLGKWTLTQLHLSKDFEEDEKESIRTYVSYVESLREQKPDFEAVEQKFHLKDLHPMLFGTSDHVCYFKKTKTLYVTDFKNGAGVGVEVFEEGEANVQLLYYGLGAVLANQFPIENVVITIVQPRYNHEDGAIRSHRVSFGHLFEFQEMLVDDALATENPNAPLLLGDHCRWCDAALVCPKKNEQALQAAREAFAVVEEESLKPAIYTPEKLSAVLSVIPQLETWCKMVREFAYREAESGRVPLGFKLVDKRANRKWKEETTAVELELVTGLEEKQLFKEPQMLSPKQIEDLLPKKLKSILEPFYTKQSSGRTLVPIDDARVEIDIIKKAFEVLEV